MNYFRELDIVKHTSEVGRPVRDAVVEEYALTLLVNGSELAILLCLPVHLKFLCVGFLASAGLIDNANDIKQIKIDRKKGIAQIQLHKDIGHVLKHCNLHTVTVSACSGWEFYSPDGLACTAFPGKNGPVLDYAAVISLVCEFEDKCSIFKQTGGAHACAFSYGGNIGIFHEDIGRHNAMDKVIGHCIINNIDFNKGIIITSGRISSEMLIKSARCGIPVFISRSAPTTRAVEIAKGLNITLIGFAREKRFNVYNDVQRIRCCKSE